MFDGIKKAIDNGEYERAIEDCEKIRIETLSEWDKFKVHAYLAIAYCRLYKKTGEVDHLLNWTKNGRLAMY